MVQEVRAEEWFIYIPHSMHIWLKQYLSRTRDVSQTPYSHLFIMFFWQILQRLERKNVTDSLIWTCTNTGKFQVIILKPIPVKGWATVLFSCPIIIACTIACKLCILHVCKRKSFYRKQTFHLSHMSWLHQQFSLKRKTEIFCGSVCFLSPLKQRYPFAQDVHNRITC